MSTTPTGTNLNGYSVKYWNRQTEADGDIMSRDTIIPMCSAIQANRNDIETMKAATDVINVYGTYSAFESESGEMVEAGYLTDYDIVKVLQDEEHDDMQTYWQCHKEGNVWTWYYVGDLAPYYSKSDINAFSASLSGTLSGNYYVSGNVTTAGKNLSATQTAVDGAPKVEISIKDKVEFVTVSATEKVSAKSGLITDLSAEHIHIDGASNDDWYNVALYSADAQKFFHDSGFNYNPYSQQLNVKYISANTVSANLSGTADKATSAAKAEHTQDSLTSVGSGTNAILYVSSLNLSAGSGLKWSSADKTLGIGIDLQTTTVDNVVKISSIGGSALYSQVLSGGRCIEVNTADNSINLSSTVSADKFYTTSTNGTSTATTVVNAGDISLAGTDGSLGRSVNINVTGIHTPYGDVYYTDLVNMNYVSSNNTITALVSASTVGTASNTVYLV